MNVETFEHAGLQVSIEYDDMPCNPREEFEQFGRILYREGARYTLGDEGASPEDMAEIMKDPGKFALPVFAYIHGQTALSLGGFECPWDSGQSGIIYCDRGPDFDEEQARKIFAGELETFTDYLNGSVYAYTVSRETTCEHCGETKSETVYSCCGFYGLEYCTEEAKSAAEYAAREGAPE